MIVQTLPQLKELYQVEALSPFGTLVTARKHEALSEISGDLLQELLAASPLLVFRGFDLLSKEELVEFCLSYPRGELLHWETGAVMEMTPASEAKNYLFSREAVPLHWDGAFHRVPSFLVFQCLEAPSRDAGGETRFTDTQLVWESATATEREVWSNARLTYTTEKVAHYGGSISVDLVQRHPKSGAPTLRFAEPVETQLNPVTVDAGEGVGGLDLVGDLSARFYDPKVSYLHQWEPGDYLIADNHALVHGRNAFTRETPRHLRRIQIL